MHANATSATSGEAARADTGRPTAIQIVTLVLCFLVVAADGFDVASVSYVAPLLRKMWSLTPAALGPIFGAGLFGLAVGSFVFGPLADKIGRKRVIALSLLLFGAGSLACAAAPSAGWLIVLRFLTGAGLGGAMPNAITLSSEFAPPRNRALLVTLMFCGFTLGLAFGGAVASVLIPSFGWQGVFAFGGLFPLVLAPCIWLWLPESLRFMAGKPRYAREAQRVAQRLGEAAHALLQGTHTKAGDTPRERVIGLLFSAQYRAGTALLWLAFFCTLWVYYQISSWLPLVITSAGIDPVHAARVVAMMPLGGTIGSLINARLMDRRNPFLVLAASYAIAAVAIAAIGVSIHLPSLIYCSVFVAGYGLSGAQTAANVLVAGFYTTAARATGVSWALGVGRIGSIFGSMTGGVILAWFGRVEPAFIAFAVPVVLAGAAMVIAGRLYPRRSLDERAPAATPATSSGH
ncbi:MULTISPECIES: MFS transporter [Paraburkholderia]|uniref:MFS transporter n=1 Tax=Paraburkholderia TaxID=1822464 RepID=UPI0022597ED8|nr:MULTISPECIES: MFS transporter [Paraburkholderia]MCX4162535.1 MFS transporter [Paraburkholderia megapolitana]MDN7158030.1 MFS transporter [Paraburkholderia sp. CHISQ3]MDQ6495077.1 MFS transporter [Paraburkholderia megapolitana]